MSRKSEIMQMDIQREFCGTMQVLREIWDEIGIPDDQVEQRGNTVLLHVRNLLNEMVSEEQNLKANMLAKIEKFNLEIEDLTVKLHLPKQVQKDGLTIMQKEKELRLCAARLNKMKRERMCSLASLKSVEQELCDQLCTTPCYIPSGSIPTEEQLEQLREHIETLKTEKERRKKVFASKKAEIVCIYDELNILPQSSFAQDLITDELDSFSLSTGKMDELEQLRSDLAHRKSEAQLLCESLWSQINCLWNRLETGLTEREQAKKKCPGINSNDIEQLRKGFNNEHGTLCLRCRAVRQGHAAIIELASADHNRILKKLEAEKLESLQRLTEKARSEIATYWDKCFYSADQRQQFTPASDENYTENLLDIHEEELARLHTYYEEHQHLFVNVHKWQELFQRMLELETRAHDINRYANRGGKLLQEEKERKKIHRQLPKIEEELFSAIEQWEEKRGNPFLVEGIRFSDYIHSQWEACERRKENEKQVRHEKKQQELQVEMAYGSIPKTPTKRRFIGTTSVLKTPTDSAKKTKLAPVNSTATRSVLHYGNCTAATYYSPGKPPVSTRLRTPNKPSTKPARVPLAKRALIDNKSNVRNMLAKTGPSSVKSAPNPDVDATFVRGLSTTVVSAPAANKVKTNVPEVGGTPYCDFAAEINTNAKDDKGVRSSAITDFPRV